jgi:CBS-domain-containing membrane protein
MGRIESMPTVPELVTDVLTSHFSVVHRDTLPELEPRLLQVSHDATLARCPACDQWLAIEMPAEPRSLDTPVVELLRLATTVAAETPLQRVVELLVAGSARIIVVVDETYQPLGVVTAKHVLAAVQRHHVLEVSSLTAIDAATSGGAFLPARSTLQAALRRFAEDDRDFLVSVDEHGKLSGVLMACDLPAHFRNSGAAQ